MSITLFLFPGHHIVIMTTLYLLSVNSNDSSMKRSKIRFEEHKV